MLVPSNLSLPLQEGEEVRDGAARSTNGSDGSSSSSCRSSGHDLAEFISDGSPRSDEHNAQPAGSQDGAWSAASMSMPLGRASHGSTSVLEDAAAPCAALEMRGLRDHETMPLRDSESANFAMISGADLAHGGGLMSRTRQFEAQSLTKCGSLETLQLHGVVGGRASSHDHTSYLLSDVGSESDRSMHRDESFSSLLADHMPADAGFGDQEAAQDAQLLHAAGAGLAARVSAALHVRPSSHQHARRRRCGSSSTSPRPDCAPCDASDGTGMTRSPLHTHSLSDAPAGALDVGMCAAATRAPARGSSDRRAHNPVQACGAGEDWRGRGKERECDEWNRCASGLSRCPSGVSVGRGRARKNVAGSAAAAAAAAAAADVDVVGKPVYLDTEPCLMACEDAPQMTSLAFVLQERDKRFIRRCALAALL